MVEIKRKNNRIGRIITIRTTFARLCFTCRLQVKVCPRWWRHLQFPVSPNCSPHPAHRPSPSPPTAPGPSPVRCGQLGATQGLQDSSPATATHSLCPTSRRVLRPLPSDRTPLTLQMAPLPCCRSLRLWRLRPSTPCTPSSPCQGRATSQAVRAPCPAVNPEVMH